MDRHARPMHSAKEYERLPRPNMYNPGVYIYRPCYIYHPVPAPLIPTHPRPALSFYNPYGFPHPFPMAPRVAPPPIRLQNPPIGHSSRKYIPTHPFYKDYSFPYNKQDLAPAPADSRHSSSTNSATPTTTSNKDSSTSKTTNTSTKYSCITKSDSTKEKQKQAFIRYKTKFKLENPEEYRRRQREANAKHRSKFKALDPEEFRNRQQLYYQRYKAKKLEQSLQESSQEECKSAEPA